MRIALIEDNLGDARLLKELLLEVLKPDQFELDHSTTLHHGLQQIKINSPDVVLLDLSLPDSNGLDSVRQTIDSLPNIPVIVLTGQSNHEIATQTLRLGVQDYLNKGQFNGEELLRAIRHSCERKQLLCRLTEHEHQIEKNHHLLETVVNNNVDGIIVLDMSDTVVFFNPAAQQIIGAQQLRQGKRLTCIQLTSSEEQQVEIKSDRSQKQTLDIRHTPILWNNQDARLVSIRDITETRQLEHRLNTQVKMLTAIHESTRNLVDESSLEEIAKKLVQTCVNEFGADGAWLMWIDDLGQHTSLAQYPTDQKLKCPNYMDSKQYTKIPPDCPTAMALSTRSTQIVSPQNINAEGCLCKHRMQQDWKSLGVFPVLGRRKIQGILNLFSSTEQFFSRERSNFFQSFVNLAAASLENAQLFHSTTSHLKQYQALRSIDIAITGSMDIKLTLEVILGHVLQELNCDACAVLLCSQGCSLLSYIAGKGFNTAGLEHFTITGSEGIAGVVAKKRELLSIPDIMDAKETIIRLPQLQNEGIRAYQGIPLLAKGKVLGVLEIFHRRVFKPNQEWLSFLRALTTQTAIAIDNVSLFQDLESAHANLFSAYDETIEGWARALDYRDHETEGHSRRVTNMTVMMAREVGLELNDIVHIRRGALLHDIGKLGVADNILHKPGPLNEEEWKIMKQHPQIAYELISPIEYLRPAVRIPYCHHEKWDGSGYPRGLKGKQIPIEARIFSIIDVYDALRSNRPYRPGWPEEKVRAYLQEKAGTDFDPYLVEKFQHIDFGVLDDINSDTGPEPAFPASQAKPT